MKTYLKEEDLKLILGGQVTQICYGHYQVILNFNTKISITVSDKMEYYKKNILFSTWSYKKNNEQFCTNNILEVNITAFQFNNDNLEINFFNEDSIKIYRGLDEFESILINLENKFIAIP